MSLAADPAPGRAHAWLLLVFQLPSRTSNARVKTWRRLQKLGALAVKNSVYVLPNTPQSREDLEWLKAEIVALKGQVTVFAADGVESLSGDEIVAAFRSARGQDFEALRREAAKLVAAVRGSRSVNSPRRRRLERAARLLRERWNEISEIDFFGAPGRDEAATALEELDRRLEGAEAGTAGKQKAGELFSADGFRNRIWVTRPRPGIDRMASAWLIRRFVDPRAEFRFAEKPDAGSDMVPFDMYGVEFSHQGNTCTFETLVRQFGIGSPAVEWLGQIVHDLDLKDERYAVPEAAAVGRLVDGLRQVYPDDRTLLEQGMAMFEALYRSAAGNAAQRKRAAKTASRRRPPR